jgi:hypothetical protein
MKSLIKNLLIGFGVGLVLMTGLAIAAGSGKADSSAHTR